MKKSSILVSIPLFGSILMYQCTKETMHTNISKPGAKPIIITPDTAILQKWCLVGEKGLDVGAYFGYPPENPGNFFCGLGIPGFPFMPSELVFRADGGFSFRDTVDHFLKPGLYISGTGNYKLISNTLQMSQIKIICYDYNDKQRIIYADTVNYLISVSGQTVNVRSPLFYTSDGNCMGTYTSHRIEAVFQKQ